MIKQGIKILDEKVGNGSLVTAKDSVIIIHSCYLSKGQPLYENRRECIALNNRELIAGFRYGIEGMRVGGRRKYQASPHLCYREIGVPGSIPPNALLIYEVIVEQIE